jgi:hypothetical protein
MQSNYRAETDLGYYQLTSLSGPAAIPTPPAGATMAIITAEGQNVRWRSDGTNPTSTVGYPLYVGAELVYTAANLSKLVFIEMNPSATLNIYFWGG